jgi:immunoglobulin-binding protein 1
VQQDIVEQRMNLKEQYKNQVFKPGHIMPTMSIEELAEMELADALSRQANDEEMKRQQEAEDSDSEEVLERERQKTARMEDWKDWNPKGAGVTQRM